MSAFSFAKAFGKEKPHSSITDWVDILTSNNIEEEAYDGVPELVDSINLQPAGPAEASRALRKKLKHGNTHQQYRALVLLKALVENGGQKFQSTFADGHLTDALKHLANDVDTDKRVKKKLIHVLMSWRDQFQSDPSMALVAGLYKHCRGEGKPIRQSELAELMGMTLSPDDEQRAVKHKAKKEKKEKDEQARKEEAERKKKPKKRVVFDFEKEKPKVLSSIAEASQASSNLVNAIRLVNPATDNVQTNERVQDCLTKAKQSKKLVVRYIQLVENEEIIGTLIETNERIGSALELYDRQLAGDTSFPDDTTEAISASLAASNLGPPMNAPLNAPLQPDVSKGKENTQRQPAFLHPDLEHLNFGPLGHSSSNLPAPLRPTTLSDDEQETPEQKPSLSDFSDYESSDEETHKAKAGPSSKRHFITVSDDEGPAYAQFTSGNFPKAKVHSNDDPFADPFADR